MLVEIRVRRGMLDGIIHADRIIQDFPGTFKSDDMERGVVTFEVEEELTEKQIALLDEWSVREFVYSWETVDDAPRVQEPQSTLIDEILATPVHKVPSNGNTRFYMEPEADKRWDRRHHLIDMNGESGPMSSFLSIAEFSSGIESSSVQHVHLSYNEVDELLAILLQWRMSHEDKRVEDAKPENALGDLNAHPF